MMCGPSFQQGLTSWAQAQGVDTSNSIFNKGKRGSGEQSSGGIGSAMAITRPSGSGSTRMQRKGSLTNFMALFGPQQDTSA